MDDQVKVGGFRIELGEVENAMRSVDGIEEAVVITVERDRGTQLAGYYVTDGALTPDHVRRELAARVAYYMVPASVVRVEKIPLNRNGKADKEQLAKLRSDAGAARADRDRGRVRGTEGILHDVVADVLDADGVDVDRNFFDIGVTSLALLAVKNGLRAKTGHDLPLTLFFEFTSIAALAAHLDAPADAGAPARDDPAEPDEHEKEQTVRTQLLMTSMMDDSEGDVGDV